MRTEVVPCPGHVNAVDIVDASAGSDTDPLRGTMGSNYNGALRPPVVFVRDGRSRLVVRRETLADLMARDVPQA